MKGARRPKVGILSASLAVPFVSVLLAAEAHAWVVSEHADISARALQTIDARATASEKAALLEIRRALHLCAAEGKEHCPTLAMLPALAGDHACTPAELRRVLDAASTDSKHWVHGVIEVAAKTRGALRGAGHAPAKRADIRRQMHVDLQAEDQDYLSRALLDYSHFQVTRESGSRVLPDYLSVALAPTSQANATATYANFHVVAIRFAAAAQREADPAHRLEALTRAFLAESFALHFLEDSFSAGHFVGHWGDSATRLGTHDFYSAEGIEASQWNDTAQKTFVAHGDAFLSDAETARAGAAVAESLLQMLAAATDREVSRKLVQEEFHDVFGEDEYDTCGRKDVPVGLLTLTHSPTIEAVVGAEPVPSARYPAVARVRAEKGFFFGGAATAAASYEVASRTIGEEVRGALRLGVGAAGVVDDPLNAQAFADVGFVGQYTTQGGSHTSLTGYSFRIRAPGYLFFVDGAVAVILAQTLEDKCPFCLSWGAKAAGGGLFKLWRSCPLFGSFSMQFSALRDVAVNWFRNEPVPGRNRVEILAPVITIRSVVPIAGETLSQSTDLYVDLGPSFTISTEHPAPHAGIFLSLAMASRVFP